MICSKVWKTATPLRVVETTVTFVTIRITDVAASLRMDSWRSKQLIGRAVRNLTGRLRNETAAKSLDKIPVNWMIWKVV